MDQNLVGLQNPDRLKLEHNTPDTTAIEKKQAVLTDVAIPGDNQTKEKQLEMTQDIKT